MNATVTAATSSDVGPTPYYIEIFDENGTLVKACGSGTTCATHYMSSESRSHLVAFVALFSTTLPWGCAGQLGDRDVHGGRVRRAGAVRGAGEH